MIILRPYQERCLEEMREHIRHQRDVLLTAPCGSGKGTIITYMVERAVSRGKHVIFAVHGKSLVVDMSQRVSKLGIPHGVLMGSHKRERWHPVQVASIDTLHRMEHPPTADLMIVDEAHMSMSPTWRKALARYPSARVVGVTATPCRLDKKGLGRNTGGLFDALVMGPTENQLIRDGYLVGSRVLAPPPPKDLGAVKKVAGEFDQKEQAAVCDKTKIIGDIVEHWRKHANGAKTCAFGIDQAHAKHIAESFNAAGYSWAYVDADTSLEDRARVWRDLDEGDLRGVASVGITMIGWDHPVVSCLIAARKTASLGLWRQMLGRGSRIHPGKTHFLVLDHVGNSHFHVPYGLFEDEVPWRLDGDAVAPSDVAKQERYVTCKVPAMVDGVIKYPCYNVFKPGPRECPFCGIPLAKKIAKIEVEDGELREVRRLDPDPVRNGNGAAPHQQMAAYKNMLAVAQKRGYKLGWAAHLFKERFGHWPPREWTPREAPVYAGPVEEGEYV
jgi:DNA repair protein RadD